MSDETVWLTHKLEGAIDDMTIKTDFAPTGYGMLTPAKIASGLVRWSLHYGESVVYQGSMSAEVADELVKLGGLKGYRGNDLIEGKIRYWGDDGELIWEVAVQMLEREQK